MMTHDLVLLVLERSNLSCQCYIKCLRWILFEEQMRACTLYLTVS